MVLLERNRGDITRERRVLVQRALHIPRETDTVLGDREERRKLLVRAFAMLLYPRDLILSAEDGNRAKVLLLLRQALWRRALLLFVRA